MESSQMLHTDLVDGGKLVFVGRVAGVGIGLNQGRDDLHAIGGVLGVHR